MKRYLAALLAFMAALPAQALDQPKGSTFDPRIQRVDYNEQDVVQIHAGLGYATHIVFAPGEEVLPDGIASGFSAGWDFMDHKNNFYLKPKSIKDGEGRVTQPTASIWNTNLVVVTNKRSYSFMLALHERASPKITFRVVFAYPEAEVLASRAETNRKATQEKLDRRAPARNWNYTMQVGKDSEEIAPAMAYDDGRFTYLRFPGNRDLPAVFDVAGDKTESMVNTHVDPKVPDVLVIQRVSKELVLRSGQLVVGVYNEAYDAHGVPAKTGTTVPGVQRRIKPGITLDEGGGTEGRNAPQPQPATMTAARREDDPRAPWLPPDWNPNAPIPPAYPPLGVNDEH
jgi:P-type conjugative transfer protein VirB9